MHRKIRWTGKVGFISSTAEFTPKTVQTEELRTSLVYEVRVFVDDPRRPVAARHAGNRDDHAHRADRPASPQNERRRGDLIVQGEAVTNASRDRRTT